MKTNGRIRTRMSKLQGTLRQKNSKGNYYYRLTIANGVRKEFALKTSDEEEAVAEAEKLDSIYLAPTIEVAAAQINAYKGFAKRLKRLTFEEAWTKYEEHPERAMPFTVNEQLSYKTNYNEFVSFITSPGKHTTLTSIADLNGKAAEEYAAYMKTIDQAVETHNRKIKRLRKVFECLKDYYSGENPFKARTLLRSSREEHGLIPRRQAFTKEQELELCRVLASSKYKVLNKAEIRVIYYLGMFTGQRLKDCVLLQWQNVDMKQGRINIKQFKTCKAVTIPIAKELFQVLQEAAKWKCDQYVCPKTAARYNKKDARGKNVGNNLVNIDVLRVIKWIGLEPSISVPGRKKKATIYGFHSLRHSFTSFCAEAGISKAVLLSIIGTDSEIADKYYTHIGENAQREAIEAVSNWKSEKTPLDRIHSVLALLNNDPEPTPQLLQEIRSILEGKDEI